MQPPAKGSPPPRTGRGRAPARWTGWELALIVLSALMIVFPLYAEATRWIMPPLAPAQGSVPSTDPAGGATSAPVVNTDVPPTDVPPTDVPPTDVPPTSAPPTDAAPTSAPPTDVPPTDVPPTDAAPTSAPPTDAAPTSAPSDAAP
ncbi:MAG: hypothetical protein WCJ55_19480, partial [Chloroflexales bacterium]